MSEPEVRAITVRGVSHWFLTGGIANRVLWDIDLDVRPDEFMAIVGPSGCGKTTILNIIGGLLAPTEGEATVRIDGEPVAVPDPSVGFMFARDALLPWRNLVSNVALGLEQSARSRAERREQSRRMIERVGLAGAEHLRPGQLSQGMRQRANLARTWVADPRLILMDEPFGALDWQTKSMLQKAFLQVWEPSPRAVVFITHDLTEAAYMADRVVVMRTGRIAGDFTVPFPRPRHDDLKFAPEVGDFVQQLMDAQRGVKG